MTRNVFAMIVIVLFSLLLTGPASAALSYDANVYPDVIFGSGNANGSFTIDQSNGVELGLRAKVRYPVPLNVFNSNGDGTYSFDPGHHTNGLPLWCFEWSINTDYTDTTSQKLDDLTYLLMLDFDPSQGTSFNSFDPINVSYADHSIGDNTTANGMGVEAPKDDTVTYANLIANNNVAQNSWNMIWFMDSYTFDPDVDGTYDIRLLAFDGGTQVAATEIQVIVGEGGAPVPVPAGVWLLGSGIVGLLGIRRRLS